MEGYEIVPVRGDPWMMRRADPKKCRCCAILAAWLVKLGLSFCSSVQGDNEDAGGVVV